MVARYKHITDWANVDAWHAYQSTWSLLFAVLHNMHVDKRREGNNYDNRTLWSLLFWREDRSLCVYLMDEQKVFKIHYFLFLVTWNNVDQLQRIDLAFGCRMVVFEWEGSSSNPSGMTQVYLSLTFQMNKAINEFSQHPSLHSRHFSSRVKEQCLPSSS